ncbi:hypothetical protein [Halorarum salinum]|uniref:Uncharacterized protein n=1 Tax=Halorarum salinum TaxID=2743089 RepID=A0A7D5LAG8_9EURY|nr:hypothetical protein [Halobaculum salinum]QLG62053.1 hypothetical protein HUG12_10070 [Halobaculum salinum]
MSAHREDAKVSFVGDDFDHRYEDLLEEIAADNSEWMDATAETLYYMMEDGWKPDKSQYSYVMKQFEDAGRLKHLAKFLEKWADLESGQEGENAD